MTAKNTLFIILISILFKTDFILASDCSLNEGQPEDNTYLIPQSLLILKKPLYDFTDNQTYRYYGTNISDVSVKDSYKYATTTFARAYYTQGEIFIYQINEKIEPTKFAVNYNFTIALSCNNGGSHDVYVTAPLIDTNNNKPFFDFPLYKYNLFSTYPHDFIRLQELDPIIATDYDVTNPGLVFSIQENPYFDIQNNGVVPGTLNKKYYARLVPKKQTTFIDKPLDLKITVTDQGFPPHTNTSRILINPPSPPAPVFDKPYYIGHYYKNGSFTFDENPQLLQGLTYYKTSIDIIDKLGNRNSYFYIKLIDDVIQVKLNYYELLPNFYEHNYSAYVLEARYTDEDTGLYSIGKSTLIVELHHYL